MPATFEVATDVEQPFLIIDDRDIILNPNYPSPSRKDEPKLQEARFTSLSDKPTSNQSAFSIVRAIVFGDVSKPAILKVDKLEAFPNLDGMVYVKVIDFEGKAKIDEALAANEYRFGSKQVAAALVRHSACDDSGQLIFTDADLASLEGFDSRFIEAVVEESAYLNGYFKRSQKELVGN